MFHVLGSTCPSFLLIPSRLKELGSYETRFFFLHTTSEPDFKYGLSLHLHL